MLAAKTVNPRFVTFEAPHSAPTTDLPADDLPVRVASEQDPATVSPVHAMQSRLARELRRSRKRAPWRLDLVKVLLVAVNVAAWWGLIALGAYLVHHFAGR
jgi:hypothetical protein